MILAVLLIVYFIIALFVFVWVSTIYPDSSDVWFTIAALSLGWPFMVALFVVRFFSGTYKEETNV